MPSFAIAQDFDKTVLEYDKAGNVKSVYFSKIDNKYGNIKSADVFFREILKISDDDRFTENNTIRLDDRNETFEQYYKGIKVENAGYTFHYDENGCMRYAHGNYVRISNIDINPTINKEEARNSFARHEGISSSYITNYSSELIIKNIIEGLSVTVPRLVYKVTIDVRD